MAFGRLDGVALNAGIVAPPMPLAEMDAERLRRMFDVNVLGLYLCARQTARVLSTARGGTGGSIASQVFTIGYFVGLFGFPPIAARAIALAGAGRTSAVIGHPRQAGRLLAEPIA